MSEKMTTREYLDKYAEKGQTIQCYYDDEETAKFEGILEDKNPSDGSSMHIDVKKIFHGGTHYLGSGGHYSPTYVKIIKSNNTITMGSLLSKFKNLTLGEPDKSFLKAGVIDEKKDLTDEGKVVFDQFLLDKFKDEFNKEVVQPILEGDKELEANKK